MLAHAGDLDLVSYTDTYVVTHAGSLWIIDGLVYVLHGAVQLLRQALRVYDLPDHLSRHNSCRR